MTPKYIDTHSHVNFKAFDEDRDEVIRRALEDDTWMINVGTQKDTSENAVDLANKYEKGVYAIIGLHPIHTDASYHDKEELGEGNKEFSSRGEIFDKELYKKLLKNPRQGGVNKKVVGIGECGLDYFRCTEESISKQKETFRKQIELACEFDLPLMLHVRNNPKDKTHDAYKDVLDMLKQYPGARGNMHFFAGDWQTAKSFLDIGFTLSFTGVITFTHDYDEIIKNIPLDMIMSETDSPYVAPAPYRGKRNEPSYVKEVVKKIAEIKNIPEPEVAKAIITNVKRVFKI